MLSRDAIKGIATEIDKRANESREERLESMAEQQDQQAVVSLSWASGGYAHESSMINARDLPIVNIMINRVKSKYARAFQEAGGTQAILQTLQTYLTHLIEEEKITR